MTVATTDTPSTLGSARPRHGRRGLAAALALAAGGALAVGLLGTPTEGRPAQDTRVSGLVDRFEQVTPFRGTRNELLPAELGGGVALGDVVLEPGPSAAGVTRDGYRDYGTVGATQRYRVVAASDGPGRSRVGFVIDDPGLTRFDVPVRLPAGAVVDNEASGAVTVTGTGGSTTLAPATAVDADGRTVPASYRIVDGALQVRVDLSDAVLPVLVDPSTTWHWWGKTEYYSRAEVRQFADWYSVVRVANAACRGLPAVCGKTVGRYTGWIHDTWQTAKRNNQCLAMSMTYTGQVTAIRPYSC